MKCRATLFLVLLLSALPTFAASPFSGAWSCRNTDGFELFVSIELKSTAHSVSGTWSNGTRIRLHEGELQGNVRGIRLYFSECNNGAHGQDYGSICPKYGPPDSYLEYRQRKMYWYSKAGNKYKLFYVLAHGAIKIQEHASQKCSNAS